jgi:hypothetical protein
MKSAWTRKSIKAYQIPAMQMFQQAEQGTSSWREAGDACRALDLFDEAIYAYRMAKLSNALINILMYGQVA